MPPLVLAADTIISKDILTIAAGSILVTALLAVWMAFAQPTTPWKYPVVLVCIAVLAFAIFLFAGAGNGKGIQSCKQTLAQVRGIAQGKLLSADTPEETKALAQAQIDAIDNSACKP